MVFIADLGNDRFSLTSRVLPCGVACHGEKFAPPSPAPLFAILQAIFF